MKQKLLNSFKLRAVMLVAILCAGFTSAWGDNNVSTVSARFSANGDVTSNFTQAGTSTSASWNLAVTWGSGGASWQNLDGTKGAQIGSGSKPATGIVLTGTNIPGTITSVVVNTSGASSVSATVAVSVGGTPFKCNNNNTASLTSTATNYTFTGSGSGNIVITWTNNSSKAIYIKSVTTTYTQTSLQNNDLALTGDPITLNFDLYNNSDAQVINYTTSSTGAVTVATSDYIEAVVDATAKTITVTPVKKTPSAQTITVNQGADATYAVGSTTFTVNVANSAPATIYEKVTDASTLRAGDKFLFVYEVGKIAMGGVNGSFYDGVSVDLDNSEISITNQDVNVITLGGSAGAWTFNESLGGKYLALTSANNALHTAENAEATTAQWTISISDGVATVQNVGTTGRTLKWNSGSPRFACYTSGQSPIAIYRKQDSRLTTTLTFADALNLDLNGGASVIGDLAAAVLKAGDDVLSETVTYTIAPNGGLAYDASTGKATATAIGTYTITASYAGDATYKAAEDAVCTVTVENSAIVTPPTLSIASGTAVTYGTPVTISDPDDDYMYFYTTDGSDPACDANLEATGTSAEFPAGGLSITAATNLKVVAADEDAHLSEVVTASYTIAAPAAPTLDTAAGAIDEGTVVKVNDYDSDLLYFYTTDGSNPAFAELSPTGTTLEYADNTGIMINEAMTLKVIAVDLGGNASEVTSAAYTIKAVPVIDLRGKETAVEFADFSQAGSQYTTAIQGEFPDTENNTYGMWTKTNCSYNSNTHTLLQMKGGTGSLTSPLIKSDDGYKVTVTYGSTQAITITIGEDSQTGANPSGGSSTQDATVELTTTSTAAPFTIASGSNAAYVKSIVITPTVIKSVATPVITLASGTYEEVKTTAITCETTGANIYYTLDGTEPTAQSTQYTSDIEITESCTLNAIAIKDGESSFVASATYIIDLPLTTIAQVKEKENNTSVKVNLTNAQVVFVHGNDIYIRDASGAIDLYNSEIDGLETGDIFDATFHATFTLYKGLPELKSFTTKTINKKGNSTVIAKTITTAAEAQANVCDLVKFENVQLSLDGSNYLIGETGLVLYNKFSAEYAKNTGEDADISGIVIPFGNSEPYTYEICPRVGEDIVYIENSEEISISSVGYSTYCSDNNLDFTGTDAIKVFYATCSGSELTFQQIHKVAAGTGVLLVSANGGAVAATHVPFFDGDADATTGNVFVRGAGVAVTYDEQAPIYVLFNGEDGIGFYKANNNNVATNRAYVQVPAGIHVKSFAINLDDTDAIGAIKAVNDNADIFNLAGQRVNKAQKGIYIINGKKVLVK